MKALAIVDAFWPRAFSPDDEEHATATTRFAQAVRDSGKPFGVRARRRCRKRQHFDLPLVQERHQRRSGRLPPQPEAGPAGFAQAQLDQRKPERVIVTPGGRQHALGSEKSGRNRLRASSDSALQLFGNEMLLGECDLAEFPPDPQLDQGFRHLFSGQVPRAEPLSAGQNLPLELQRSGVLHSIYPSAGGRRVLVRRNILRQKARQVLAPVSAMAPACAEAPEQSEVRPALDAGCPDAGESRRFPGSQQSVRTSAEINWRFQSRPFMPAPVVLDDS